MDQNQNSVLAGKEHRDVPSAESAIIPKLDAALKVKFFPYRRGLAHGNIVWAERDRGSDYYRVSKFAMKGGVFPPNHPVGGTHSEVDRSQMGSGEKIEAFRARGYWASCFPEGDGITFSHEDGRTDEQVVADIQECFGWDVEHGLRAPE